jgi:2-aminoadipate transaminase
MISDLYGALSHNVRDVKRSAIRELLKLTQQPDIISFAGGLPSPESFPVEDLKEVMVEVLEKEASYALQYGTTEGDTLLVDMIIEHYRQFGITLGRENVLITTSSQQGLDLVSKIFLNRGDKVVVCLPSYLGGLQAFTSYGAQPVGVPLENEGMSALKLEELLEEMKSRGEKPKFIYTVPDFQNPAGVTMPESRREQILALAKKYDVLLIEDSPYRELRFEGETPRALYQMDNTGHVLFLGTFSKIFVPGFRLGWILAHKDIIEKLVIAKQATDLCTSAFNQRTVGRFIQKGYLTKSIRRIKEMYREKRDIMLKAFQEYMPAGVTWTRPEGGLFLFLRLPEYMDSGELLMEALKKKVAYVVGANFYCNGQGKNTMRINFSFPTKEQNVEGVKRLAQVIREAMKAGQGAGAGAASA